MQKSSNNECEFLGAISDCANEIGHSNDIEKFEFETEIAAIAELGVWEALQESRVTFERLVALSLDPQALQLAHEAFTAFEIPVEELDRQDEYVTIASKSNEAWHFSRHKYTLGTGASTSVEALDDQSYTHSIENDNQTLNFTILISAIGSLDPKKCTISMKVGDTEGVVHAEPSGDGKKLTGTVSAIKFGRTSFPTDSKVWFKIHK